MLEAFGSGGVGCVRSVGDGYSRPLGDFLRQTQLPLFSGHARALQDQQVGGELLKQGVSLIAITAFILAWTTVGVFMLPLEAKFLGKRFAITRNIINFIFAIIIAVLTVAIFSLIHD